MVLFFMIVHIWCRLFYDKPPTWFKQNEPLSLYDNRILVPLVLVTGPLLSNFVELQVNVLMLFFVSMGLLAIRNEREWKAGFWLGLTTAVKAYPAVFAVWLVFRKRWTALAGMVAWAVALTFLPFFRFGLDGPWVTFKRWLDISAGGAYPLTCGNQSVYAALARWILFDWQTMIHVKLVSPSSGYWGCRLASALFALLFVLCLSVFVFLAKRKRFQSDAIEGSIFCMLMVLFSPIAWKHYWTMTFPAWFCLFGVWNFVKDRLLLAVLCCAFVFVTVLPSLKFIRSLVGCGLSAYTIGGMLLLVGLLYIAGKGYMQDRRASILK
jgi:hypothetical protein